MFTTLPIEWIKLLKNALFWIGLIIFSIFVTGILKINVIDLRIKELSSLIGEASKMLALPIIFFNGFIPTLVGQQFRYNTLKFELIAGRSRLGKFWANIVSIANYSFLFTLVFVLLSVAYLYIDVRTMPNFNLEALKNCGIVFCIFFFYSYFLNTLTLLIRNTGLSMFIAFLYFFGNSLLMLSPYADIASFFPVGAMYTLLAPPDLSKLIAAGLEVELCNPYIVFAATIGICLLINLWQFLYRDVK